jgi:predicted helicase
MERYAVTTHKESGIRNDPNDWAAEHGDPRYILDLLLSVITVSIKTVEIVKKLPEIAWKM